MTAPLCPRAPPPDHRQGRGCSVRTAVQISVLREGAHFQQQVRGEMRLCPHILNFGNLVAARAGVTGWAPRGLQAAPRAAPSGDGPPLPPANPSDDTA